VGSVLPPAPTISSSRAHVNREPELTAGKATTSPDTDSDSTSNGDAEQGADSQPDSGEHDSNNNFDSDHDIGGYDARILSPSVRIGPPPRAKRTQPGEPVTTTADTSDLGILDVKMHSPPHALSSQRGRGRTVKAIGSLSGSQLARSSGASKPYGATIRGRALGNAPNIGDFNAIDGDTPVDVEGTVNLFPSNTRPTTVDIDETAVIAVTIPFEGALAPLLQHIVKYYSSMSGKHFKYYLNLNLNYFIYR
jgi:hypothetical protein